MSRRGAAFIAGVFEHPRRDIPDRTVPQLHAEVAAGALADAGLALDDVDAFYRSGDTPGFGPISLAEYLGLRCCVYDSTESAGPSYLLHVGHAAAIAAGTCGGRPSSPGMRWRRARTCTSSARRAANWPR